MADIGYRMKGDSGPLYNPERDYAYITPTLMRQAIEKLDVNDNVNREKWRREQDIKESEIVAIAEALAAAQRDFVNAADPVSNFEIALNRHNFFSFRYPVQQYLWAAIGEVFCAAWFLAVREVSVVGQESPAQADMARFVAAVREFANKHKSSTYDANFMAEHLRMLNDTLLGREKELVCAYKKKNDEVLHLRRENDMLKKEFERLKAKKHWFFGLFAGRNA